MDNGLTGRPNCIEREKFGLIDKQRCNEGVSKLATDGPI